MATKLDRNWLIAMAASAGGIAALTQVLGHIPPGFPASIIIVLHRRATRQTLLDKILAKHTSLPVTLARPGEQLAGAHEHRSGGIASARHRGRWIRLSRRHSCSRRAVVGESIARVGHTVFRDRMIAVVLTGRGVTPLTAFRPSKLTGAW